MQDLAFRLKKIYSSKTNDIVYKGYKIFVPLMRNYRLDTLYISIYEVKSLVVWDLCNGKERVTLLPSLKDAQSTISLFEEFETLFPGKLDLSKIDTNDQGRIQESS